MPNMPLSFFCFTAVFRAKVSVMTKYGQGHKVRVTVISCFGSQLLRVYDPQIL